ncbi:hypothetical protein [Ferribacterium limneticum]|nr:hypothetical protein [Ferribacterium limneticum]UCV23019.1 hypothetical protein KI613_00270 [Ferribacterium limneticum]
MSTVFASIRPSCRNLIYIATRTRRAKISKAAIQGNATPSESYRLLG